MSPLDPERREYLKETVRKGMRKRDENVDEEKVERIVSDTIVLAEIFLESERARIRRKKKATLSNPTS